MAPTMRYLEIFFLIFFQLRKVEAAARKLNESVASAQTLSNTPKLMQSMTTVSFVQLCVTNGNISKNFLH